MKHARAEQSGEREHHRPLLWRFFFLDADKSKLQSAGADLAARGYRLANISPTKSGDRFRLRVERVETLTPATL